MTIVSCVMDMCGMKDAGANMATTVCHRPTEFAHIVCEAEEGPIPLEPCGNQHENTCRILLQH